jgi:tetratricopeptide (TPR) repeat protein
MALLILVVPFGVYAQKATNKKKTNAKAPVRKEFIAKPLPVGLSKADSTAFVLKQKNEAAAAERWRILDSTTASRKLIRDSISAWRENRADSIARITKYKASRRYTDSVERVKTKRADSLKYERMAKLEDLKDARKARLDSLVKARKASMAVITKAREATKDSMVNARKEIAEALKAKRKVTADSIAKAKKVKAALVEKKKKLDLEKLKKGFKTEDEKQMAKAMALHQKKNAEFTNQNFLKKPFTLNKRIYQNTVTRYNYYYNAKNKYNLKIDEQTKERKIDYNKLLDLSAYNATESASAVGSEMDSVIKKCATSIQIHDPRSKWFDDLYLLTGKAYFAKNDMDNAIATFQYIASEYKDKPKPKAKQKNVPRKKVVEAKAELPQLASIENRKGIRKLRHHGVRNDALLWLANSYVQAENYSDAQSLVSLLENDANFPKRLKPDLYLLNAKINIATQSELVAIESLQKALKAKKLSAKNKQLTNFVLGQLLTKAKDYEQSNKYYKEVIKLVPTLDMDFYAKVNMAKNISKGEAGNVEEVENMFRKIINDGKYEKYLDRAYLALAQTITAKKPEKAITYFNKSIESKNVLPEVKGEAYLNLADLYFNQLQYVNAQICYDSALAFLPENTSYNKIEIQNRKDVLTDLVAELNVIQINDSLLALSKMTEKEQKAIAKAAMKQARQAAEKSMQALEESQSQTVGSVGNTGNNANGNGKPSANSTKWYFSNPATIKAGTDKFIAKYGNRPNVDDWNRKATLGVEQNGANGGGLIASGDTSTVEVKEDDGDISSYLSLIPKSPERISNCNLAIENALYNAAIIYYSGLNDNEKTIEFLEKLLKDYPNTDYKKQAYYTLFLACAKVNRTNDAAKYEALLNSEFPTSTYAKLASNKTDASSEMESAKSVDKYYSDTYDLYNDKKYAAVQTRVAFARDNYATSALRPKFELLHIMSDISLKNLEKARVDLQDLIQANSGTEEATLAQDILALMNKNGVLRADTNNVLNSLTPSFDKPNIATSFSYDPKAPHIFLIVVKSIDGRLEAMRSGMSDFNTINHSLEKIENTFYLIDQNTGVCVYKQFPDEKKARVYMRDVINNKNIYSVFKASELEMCLISAENYELFKNTRNLAGYLNFYKKNYK